jgi:hypothetical protein
MKHYYLTTDDVASKLNVSIQTVRRMCSNGAFPNAVLIDPWGRESRHGRWRIPADDVQAYLDAHRAARLINVKSKTGNGHSQTAPANGKESDVRLRLTGSENGRPGGANVE